MLWGGQSKQEAMQVLADLKVTPTLTTPPPSDPAHPPDLIAGSW